MINARPCLLAGAALALCSLAAADEAVPHRRAGLWETSLQMAARPGRPVTSQACIDEKSDLDMRQAVSSTDTHMKCDRTSMQKISGGFESDSVCKSPIGTLTTHMRVTGDFRSSYHMEVTGHRDPPLHGIGDTHTLIDARWLGACPADMKPGDMRMNGMTMHIPAKGDAPGTTRRPMLPGLHHDK